MNKRVAFRVQLAMTTWIPLRKITVVKSTSCFYYTIKLNLYKKVMLMIAGHLTAKNGRWYMVIETRTDVGIRKPKWMATGLKVKGNKKKAEEMLYEKKLEYSLNHSARKNAAGIFFDEYLQQWLYSRKGEIAQATYDSYEFIIQRQIAPYFKEQERKVLLSDLKPIHISNYYQHMMAKGLSPNTVARHHANIHKSLEDAVFHELLPFNPARNVRLPRKSGYTTNPYSTDECNKLLEVVKGAKLELIVTFALFTGLRKSEILGLRWSAINFTENTILVNHSVIRSIVDGKTAVISQDKLKRDASFRTLPMIEPIRDLLFCEIKRRYGMNSFLQEDYIFVDEKGVILKPNYISEAFPKLLKKHNLRHIRFHDLRHSCANLLITSRVPLIEVQQWMGHSNISTTADMYGHLTFENKLNSAETIKKN